MKTISFKGKTYDLKEELSFGDMLALQELQEEIDMIKAQGDEDALGKLGMRNIRLIADTLHRCLGFDGRALKQFSFSEAVKIFNEIVVRSTEIDPKSVTPSNAALRVTASGQP